MHARAEGVGIDLFDLLIKRIDRRETRADRSIDDTRDARHHQHIHRRQHQVQSAQPGIEVGAILGDGEYDSCSFFVDSVRDSKTLLVALWIDKHRIGLLIDPWQHDDLKHATAMPVGQAQVAIQRAPRHRRGRDQGHLCQ